MKKLIIALALVFSCTANASHFTDVQKDNLHYAYMYGQQYTVKGKHDFTKGKNKNGLGYIMAAIAWQESSAGTNMPRKKGHHAYGMFQNYIKTVRSKVDANKLGVRDSEIIAMLEDRDKSAFWAMDELQTWLTVRKGNIRLALASYYAGWDYKKGLPYADQVLKKSKKLKKMLAVNV